MAVRVQAWEIALLQNSSEGMAVRVQAWEINTSIQRYDMFSQSSMS